MKSCKSDDKSKGRKMAPVWWKSKYRETFKYKLIVSEWWFWSLHQDSAFRNQKQFKNFLLLVWQSTYIFFKAPKWVKNEMNTLLRFLVLNFIIYSALEAHQDLGLYTIKSYHIIKLTCWEGVRFLHQEYLNVIIILVCYCYLMHKLVTISTF